MTNVLLESFDLDWVLKTVAERDVINKKYKDVAFRAGLYHSKVGIICLIKNGEAYLNEEKVEDPDLLITAKHLTDDEYISLGRGKDKKIWLKVELEDKKYCENCGRLLTTANPVL